MCWLVQFRENDVGFENPNPFVASAFDDEQVYRNLKLRVTVRPPPPLLARCADFPA